MLNKILLVIFVVVWFPFAGCVAQEAQTKNDSVVKQEAADAFIWDFGTVKEGMVVTHNFELKNDSAKALKILDVNTSCGCTGSKAAKSELAPGESTQLEVKFNSTGYSGPVKQFVFVHTDDISNPVIRFTIKADVQK